MVVCVVSVMRGNAYKKVGPYPSLELKQNKAAYCKRCGYRCFLLKDHYTTDRSPGWDKLAALKDALNKSGCSLALWLDADVVVLRPVQLAPLARTPISATKDFHGFNTGVMLLKQSAEVKKLLRASWAQTAFVPNLLGAEQSAVRYTLHMEPSLRSSTRIYQNLVRYPQQLAMSARLKWNKTLRTTTPLFHTAGCSMTQKPETCAAWLRHQLGLAQAQWQGTDSVGCVAIGDDETLPRKMKSSDSFIPYGQGRDVILNRTEEAVRLEREALHKIGKRACKFAGRPEVCASWNATKSARSVATSDVRAMQRMGTRGAFER